mgnify:CR=1 FL=1
MSQNQQVVNKGKLPAQPQPNLKGQMFIVASGTNDPYNEEAKAITTLRSGKIVDNKVEMPEEPKSIDKPLQVERKGNSEIASEPVTPHSINPLPPPFLQRLRPKANEKMSEHLDLFQQVKINIPLLKAIKQVPS